MKRYTAEDIAMTEGVKSDEQETTVSFGRNDAVAKVWTNDNTVLTKLRKLVEKAPDQWKVVDVTKDRDGKVVGYFFECPKKLIRFKTSREYTEEQKKAIANRLASARTSGTDGKCGNERTEN